MAEDRFRFSAMVSRILREITKPRRSAGLKLEVVRSETLNSRGEDDSHDTKVRDALNAEVVCGLAG